MTLRPPSLPRVLFLKAAIPHGASADLFAVLVPVQGHTTRAGITVAPHTAVRRKHLAPTGPAVRQAPMILFAAKDGLVRPPVVAHDPDTVADGAAERRMSPMNTPPSTKTPLVYSGEVQGVPCGERSSGLFVGRGPDSGPNSTVHIVFPSALAYAPNAAAAVRLTGSALVNTTGDGRVRVSKAVNDDVPVDVPAFLDKLEVALEGGRGGIPEQAYGSVYSVTQCRDDWAYEVTTKASGRASLQRIGSWTGADGVFRVPFHAQADLVALLEKADIAEVKGTTTKIKLPLVPGLSVTIAGGEIVIPWPGDADAPLVKTVPSIRWDREARAYTVSTRYSKAVAAVLSKIAARRAAVEAARVDLNADRMALAAADAELGKLSSAYLKVTTLADGRLAVAFRYHDGAVALMRSVPGALWDNATKHWRVPAIERPSLRPVIERITAHFEQEAQAAAAERDAATAQRTAEADARRSADTDAGIVRRSVFIASDHATNRLPTAGTVINLPKHGPMYVESVGVGRFIRDDAMSFGGDADSGSFHPVVYRRPDPTMHAGAIASYEAVTNAAVAERERIKGLRAVRAKIEALGARPFTGQSIGRGEVLNVDGKDAMLYGGGSTIQRAADGALWLVKGNTADGDDWSFNDVSGGIGFRIPPSDLADELAAEVRALNKAPS